jgi:hypothetical protein
VDEVREVFKHFSVLLHQICGFDKSAKHANVLESFNSTEIDGVKDQRRGRESYKTFGEGTVFRFCPLLDPVAFFSNRFWGVHFNVELDEVSRYPLEF